MAWIEVLRDEVSDKSMLDEMDKDILRLNSITDRFSKIGSEPKLEESEIEVVVTKATEYLKRRVSSKTKLEIVSQLGDATKVNLSVPLFEWVIENLVKNAVDAMSGVGEITLTLSELENDVFIEIRDTGSGIPKAKIKSVFKPKKKKKKRGWGMGLSLVKRIVEEYHNGKINVSWSQLGKGTAFLIELKRA
ncbi:MAG: sensor histidine kinase, partial [Cyclobacteriaceae bacterium]